MIVSTDGNVTSSAKPEAKVSCIVSTTGEAYRKKSVVKTIVRFFRKLKIRIKTKVLEIRDYLESVKIVFVSKSGKPQAIEPPLQSQKL